MKTKQRNKGFIMKNTFDFTKQIPIISKADLCVIGGSCTGVFAAVRAARRGLKVVLIEKLNSFGGTATASLVNVWHSLYDTDHREKIIAGLTEEVENALERQDALYYEETEHAGVRFNSARLEGVLDALVIEHKIDAYLHTFYCDAWLENGEIKGIVVANKDGLGMIQADFFIDASGDGDLSRDAGLEAYRYSNIQPPSSCFLLQNENNKYLDIAPLIESYGKDYSLEDDWGWGGMVPNLKHVSFRADFHVFDKDCSDAKELTQAEIIGREKAARFSDMLKDHVDKNLELITNCKSIGVRESVHYKTNLKVTQNDLLVGADFKDVVLKGTYRLDRHHAEDNGITFMYLDGRVDTFYGKGQKSTHSNWREELGLGGKPNKFYCAPLKMLVQSKIKNLIPVGRMINADESAFGALRVMVNLNQLGEAAGEAAALCVEKSIAIDKLDGTQVVNALKQGGSAL